MSIFVHDRPAVPANRRTGAASPVRIRLSEGSSRYRLQFPLHSELQKVYGADMDLDHQIGASGTSELNPSRSDLFQDTFPRRPLLI